MLKVTRVPRQRIALYVSGDLKLGGAERRFFRLFRYLQENEESVYLYTTENGIEGCKAIGLKFEGRNVHIFPSQKGSAIRLLRYPSLFRHVFRLVRQLQRDKISHVHFGENPGPFTFIYGLMSIVACPFSISLVDSIKAYQQSIRQKLYVRVSSRLCTRIDCLSTQIKAELCSFLGKEHEGKCLASPCSFTDFSAAALSANPTKTRDIDIALVARMTPGKGHSLLRDALSHLVRHNHFGLLVYVCGSGPLEPIVSREFQSIGGQEIHIGFEPDPFRVLQRTKVYVSLQEAENYPSQSLLEAMACECAIIATDVGLTRLLLDDSCARLIPANAEVLAHEIASLLEREELRQELGRNAKKVVASGHSVERFASYFLGTVCEMKEQTRAAHSG